MAIKSSFISTQEQVVKLNNNNIALLNGINDIVKSKQSEIKLTVTNGQDISETINLPTVGFLQTQIDRLDQNLRTLSGVDSRGSIVEPANNVFQKIIRTDLNKEPNPLGQINTVDSFKSINNSFFDALLNPILAIKFDLTNMIDLDTRKVLSKRYIVQFEKDQFGNLTGQGQDAENLFNEQFKGRNNITIDELENWIINTPGILTKPNGNKIIFDKEFFELPPNNLDFDGIYSVLGVEEDSVNNKMWYLFDTLTYTKISTNEKFNLSLDDEVIINTDFSTSRWKIIEISNAATQIRVNLERIEGFEAIPVGVQGGLKYYSSVESNRNLEVSIGFDEYNVVFLKPVNTSNNLMARDWSAGVAYYTNDLTLDSQDETGENGLSLTDYYINSVQDYGKILQDLAEKEIPTEFALKPNNPILNIDNFTVLQVNKNITDTEDTERLKTLHSQSSTLRSQLEELNKTIVEKQNELAKKQFSNVGDRQKVENEIDKLIQDSSNVSKALESTVSQIISADSQLPDVKADFRVRGFWSIPEPVSDGRTKPQEVVQFKIQYRYLSLTGQESATESFTITDEAGNTVNASFSNWVETFSPLRFRTFDVQTGTFVWASPDLSDPDSVNFNQLDIPLQPGERAQFRIQSISEVGWPSSPLESEWSDTIIISFPEELAPPKNRDGQIVENAKFDQVRLEVEQDLNDKGLTTHLSGQFTENNVFYAHNSDQIGVVTSLGVTRLSDRLIEIENNENTEETKDIVLESNWINFGSGYSKANYYKHENRVFLSGLIRVEKRSDNDEEDFDYSKRYLDVVVRSSAPTSNIEYANVGFLPLEYRPDSIKVFMIPTSIGTNDVSQTGNSAFPWGRNQRNNMDVMHGRIDVYPNGLIRLVTGATGWVSLDNIEFRVPKNPIVQEDQIQTDNILQLSRLQPGIQTEL